MKQTVTDIADVLKSMNEKLESMQKTIDSQQGSARVRGTGQGDRSGGQVP